MMNMYSGILIGIVSLLSCKRTAPNSSAQDIGVVKTQSTGGSVSGMNFIQVAGQSFAMQETEVTRGQWKALMGEDPYSKEYDCEPEAEKGVLTDDQPVSCVSFMEAERFADVVTRKINDGATYRLPSEQEWAAAAGNVEGPDYGWCLSEVYGARDVKKLKAHNGLYDMVGNVNEWTSSKKFNWRWFYYQRVSRGSDWLSYREYCGTGLVTFWYLDSRSPKLGFRLLRQP